MPSMTLTTRPMTRMKCTAAPDDVSRCAEYPLKALIQPLMALIWRLASLIQSRWRLTTSSVVLRV